jgi:magnesium transporter
MDATSDAPPSPSDATASEPVSRTRVVCWSPTGIERKDDVTGLAAMIADSTTRVWVDLVDPPPDVVEAVATEFGLHPLIAEDIAEKNQRAKIVEYDDVIHIVVFDLDYQGEVHPSEIDLVLGKRFLLSVHEPDSNLAEDIAARNGAAELLAKGADFLLYTVLDHVVDGYFPVMDRLADEIDELQDRVVESASEWTLERLFVLKRELLTIRRATSPAREVLNQSTNRDLSVIAPEHIVYFRDVYDHLIRVTDELDNYRDLVAGTLDIYLSTINNNLSRIMKRLTGVTVILAGIGAAAGIFGMSEAGAALADTEATGFWLVSALIVLAATLAAVVLHRVDWI